MGLFRRRRPKADESAPPIVNAERIRRAPVRSVQIGVDMEVVAERTTGHTAMLSYSAGEVLHACNTFDTAESHARRFSRRGELDRAGTFAEGLEELAQSGLLLGYDDAVARMRRHPERNGGATLSTLGVVTRDRPELLERCLRSYDANFRACGREVRVVVLDDSSDPAARASCRQRLASLQAELGVTIEYGGLEEKREFAQQVARHAGLPREVVDFALTGALGLGFTTGSNRNALALHASGDAYLSTDDDTIAQLAQAPNTVRDVALSCAHDPTEFWCYADREALLENVEWQEIDLIGEHERLLGRDAGACLGETEQPDLDGADDATLAAVLEGMARVVATAAGFAGDSGMGSPGHYMMLRGAQRARLVGSDASYAALRLTREVLRVAPRPTVSAGMFFMSGHFAVDARAVLPPFFPVLRNSDGIFGRTLRQVRPDGLIAHLPFGMRHEPPSSRTFDEAALHNWCGSPRASDVIITCVLSATLTAHDPTDRLRELGHYLVNLGRLPAPEFDAFVRHLLWQQRANDLQYCESLIAHYGGRPSQWASDLETAVERIQESLAQPDFLYPRDLRGVDNVDPATIARELVRHYGDLLVAWPGIEAAARALRNAGHPLARGV